MGIDWLTDEPLALRAPTEQEVGSGDEGAAVLTTLTPVLPDGGAAERVDAEPVVVPAAAVDDPARGVGGVLLVKKGKNRG